ncbi:MAG: ATP synthase subunit I [Desulfuromonadaceae bacterium]
MSEEDQDLLAQMARRNWIILILLLLASALLRNPDFSLGILCGGLTVVAGYQWLHSALVKALERSDTGAVRSFQAGYLVRLLALGVVLALLIAVAGVNIPGLVIGLSVVVVNIFWTTVKRIL